MALATATVRSGISQSILSGPREEWGWYAAHGTSSRQSAGLRCLLAPQCHQGVCVSLPAPPIPFWRPQPYHPLASTRSHTPLPPGML